MPKQWTARTLESLQAPGDYTFVGGPFGSDLTSKDYVAQPGVPVIRGTNLGGTESRFIDDGFVYVTEEKAESLRRNLAYPGDLIFTQRGTLGQVAIIPAHSRFSKYVISQSQMKLTVDPLTADTRYVYYAFRSPMSQLRFASRKQVTGVPHINLGILKEFAIPLPPLQEQQRIAAILDKADAIRCKRKEVLDGFGKLKAAVFDEMFGRLLLQANHSCLANHIEELRYGTSTKSAMSGKPALRIPNIVRGIIDLKDLKRVPVNESEFARLQMNEGDILFVRTNGNPDYVGRSALYRRASVEKAGLPPDDFVYASYLIRARLKQDELDPAFLQSYLQTGPGRRALRDRCRTSAGQYNINTKGLGSIPVPDIPIDRQREFAGRIGNLEPTAERLATAVDESDDLFNSLVQRAFRGEL